MKTILFKTGIYPLLSETFITSQIIIAKDLGYQVIFLVNKIADFETSKQIKIIRQYNIEATIHQIDYKIPKNKIYRLFKAVYLMTIYLRFLRYIIKYFKVKKQFSLTYLYELIFYIPYKKTDVIHIQYGTNARPIDDLKKSGIFKMPVIVTFHGHDAFFPINGIIPKQGYYDRIFEVAELFTANTPYLKEQLTAIDCPIQKIKTIPVPVDTAFFYPKIKLLASLEKIRILSVGRLESIKGHHLGIKAVAELLQKGYDIQYEIIGEGKSRSFLENLILELGLEKSIILSGAKSSMEIRESYWNSDIFLMTSTVVLNNIRETQGIVSIEAQACGLPVVAMDSGGVKYTIDNNSTGILCNENDIPALIIAIEKLITDYNLLNKMSQKAPVFVEDSFSLKKVSSIWENTYANLISNG